MKRNFFMAAFFVFLLLEFVFAVPVFCETAEIELSYRQLKSSRLLKTSFSTGGISFSVQLKQKKDGRFVFETPPFFAADFQNGLRIGEIQDAGIFSLMLDSSGLSGKTVFGTSAAGSDKNFKKIISPALRPSLSGLSLSLEGFDIIALSPVFNPYSPSGFGMTAQKENAFAGFLLAKQNERKNAVAELGFSPDWRISGAGKHMLFSVVGAHGKAVFNGFQAIGTLFLQNAFERLSGGGTTVGWNLKLNGEKLNLGAGRKLGGLGPNLKTIKGKDSPADSFSATLDFTGKAETAMEIIYKTEIFRSPVYGGESQKRRVILNTCFEIRGIEINVENSTSYDIDRGKVSKSVYSFSMDASALDFFNKEESGLKVPKTELSAGITLNRNNTGKNTLSDAHFSITTPNVVFKTENGKTDLEIIFEYIEGNRAFRISVNQDRLINASLKLKNI